MSVVIASMLGGGSTSGTATPRTNIPPGRWRRKRKANMIEKFVLEREEESTVLLRDQHNVKSLFDHSDDDVATEICMLVSIV
jgi:hypothetical protein